MNRANINQLTHGVPYKPRNKQPSMYEILSWNENKQSNTIKTQYDQRQNIGNQLLNKNKPLQLNILKNCSHSQYYSPHKYKHELYLYNDEDQKAKQIIQIATQDIIKKQMSSDQKRVKSISKSRQKILDPNNQSDKYEIQKRKKKIKNFKLYSRQLPDSAFTTYYGKPAFGNYGSGSKSSQMKSFNIMPHAGKNHPEYQQSYETALKKGKQIKQNYIPKKPIQIYHAQQQNLAQSDYYSIPINRPNLINNVRFSQDRSFMDPKARTPKHNQLNYLPSRQHLDSISRYKKTEQSERKRLKKVTSLKNFQNKKNDYPLVNNRDHLRDILQQKKRQQNRLAYKPTQCYPLPYQHCQKICETKASRWAQTRPAGIVSPRSDHVGEVLFTTNIWN